MIHAKNIYEFDLTAFFDSVKHQSLTICLEESGVIGQICGVIARLNKSLIKLPKELLIAEPDAIPLHGIDGSPSLNRKSKLTPEQLHPDIPADLMISMMYADMEDLDGVPLN